MVKKFITIKYLPLVILSTLVFIGNAQDTFTTISGRILDAKTNEALPFASVYLKGRPIGTTSNTNGSFVFYIPSDLKNYPVVISMIGYRTVEKLPSQFKKNETIYLQPSVLQLDEVVVTLDKPLTARQIVNKAHREIVNNYPTEPHILEGFIRDALNEDKKFVELLEYAAKFYYRNYLTGAIKIELGELRRNYMAKKHPWNEDWERKNSISDLLEDDFIRNDWGFIRGKRRWNYELEGVLPFNNKAVYKIKATKKPFSNAVLYIDVESFAFVKLELERSVSEGKYYKRRLTNGQQEAYYHMIMEYQEYNGKMYLKYQKEEDTWQIFEGLESDHLLFTKYPKKELFINKIVTENVDEYPFASNFSGYKSIENQAKPYNPEFWKFYNVPAQTPEESKIVELLRKAQEGPREE